MDVFNSIKSSDFKDLEKHNKTEIGNYLNKIMPEIRTKTLYSFSSQDSQFPAKNLLEWKITKKWKCETAGEKSCFVVLKLDQPRVLSGIDIGNERSGFIEVLCANSKQDPPVFQEILLATSFMTITEVKNDQNPNRVRFFSRNGGGLIDSVAKQAWDLIKIVCSQPFNNKIKYGISFVTLHTQEEIKYDDSPIKSEPALKATNAKQNEDSSEKKKKFGKFALRSNSESDNEDDKKKENESSFSRWKNSRKSSEGPKNTIKDQVTKLEENRKRIRMMPDSSDEDAPPKTKSNRNRSTGLLYLDEDDEPNEKLQKKLDKDKELKEKDKKNSKNQDKIDVPSTSSARSKSSQSSSRPSFSSSSSSSKHHSPNLKREKENERKSSRKEKENKLKSPKNVTYKPFHKLLEGVVFVFSGYVNPDRGILRQKAIDMGAKYKPDWDSSCTHLICAFSKTPKYLQVKGVGKIVTKRWIESCFSEQKKLSWRPYALDRDDRDQPESDNEVHNELSKTQSSVNEYNLEESDDDMVVVDKRVMNGSSAKSVLTNPESLVDDTTLNIMEISTDEELAVESKTDLSQGINSTFKGKLFYLNEDLSSTDVIKLKTYIKTMMGSVSDNVSKADYIITESGRKLPSSEIKPDSEVLTSRWVKECAEIGAFIPTARYKPKSLHI